MMICPCESKTEMIWNSDWDDQDADGKDMIISMYTCPTCEAYLEYGMYTEGKPANDNKVT